MFNKAAHIGAPHLNYLFKTEDPPRSGSSFDPQIAHYARDFHEPDDHSSF
jgi:hypothetical protein